MRWGRYSRGTRGSCSSLALLTVDYNRHPQRLDVDPLVESGLVRERVCETDDRVELTAQIFLLPPARCCTGSCGQEHRQSADERAEAKGAVQVPTPWLADESAALYESVADVSTSDDGASVFGLRRIMTNMPTSEAGRSSRSRHIA